MAKSFCSCSNHAQHYRMSEPYKSSTTSRALARLKAKRQTIASMLSAAGPASENYTSSKAAFLVASADATHRNARIKLQAKSLLQVASGQDDGNIHSWPDVKLLFAQQALHTLAQRHLMQREQEQHVQAQAKERSILDQQAAPTAASIRHPATSASSTAAAHAPAAPATDLGHAQGPKFIALQTLHGTQATGPATSAGTVPQLVLLPDGNIGVVQLPAPSMQNTHPGASGMPQLMYAGGPNGGMHGGMYPYMHPGMGYPPPPPGYMYAPTGFVPQQYGFGAETMTPSYTGTGSYTTTHGTHSTMPSTMSISPHHAHAHGYQYGMWHAGNPAMQQQQQQQHQQQHVRPSAARHAAGQEHDTSQQLHAQRQLYPMQAPNPPPQSAFPVASYQPHAQHNELASTSGQRASDPWVTYTDPRAIHSDPQATPTASHATAPSVQAHPDLVASLRDMLAVVGQQTLGSVDGGNLQEAAGVGVCVTGAGARQQGGMAGYTSNGTVTGAAGQQQLILQHRNQSQQQSQPQQQPQQRQGGTVPAQAHTCAPSVQQGAVPLTRSPSASSSVSLAGPARSASGTGSAANGDGIKGNMLQAQAPAARRLPVSEAVESPGSARASDSTPSIHSLASQSGDTHGISAEHRTSAHSMASISVASMDNGSVDAAMTPRAYRSASARYDLVTATAQAAAGLRSVVEEQPDEVQGRSHLPRSYSHPASRSDHAHAGNQAPGSAAAGLIHGSAAAGLIHGSLVSLASSSSSSASGAPVPATGILNQLSMSSVTVAGPHTGVGAYTGMAPAARKRVSLTGTVVEPADVDLNAGMVVGTHRAHAPPPLMFTGSMQREGSGGGSAAAAAGALTLATAVGSIGSDRGSGGRAQLQTDGSILSTDQQQPASSSPHPTQQQQQPSLVPQATFSSSSMQRPMGHDSLAASGDAVSSVSPSGLGSLVVPLTTAASGTSHSHTGPWGATDQSGYASQTSSCTNAMQATSRLDASMQGSMGPRGSLLRQASSGSIGGTTSSLGMPVSAGNSERDMLVRMSGGGGTNAMRRSAGSLGTVNSNGGGGGGGLAHVAGSHGGSGGGGVITSSLRPLSVDLAPAATTTNNNSSSSISPGRQHTPSVTQIIPGTGVSLSGAASGNGIGGVPASTAGNFNSMRSASMPHRSGAGMLMTSSASNLLPAASSGFLGNSISSISAQPSRGSGGGMGSGGIGSTNANSMSTGTGVSAGGSGMATATGMAPRLNGTAASASSARTSATGSVVSHQGMMGAGGVGGGGGSALLRPFSSRVPPSHPVARASLIVGKAMTSPIDFESSDDSNEMLPGMGPGGSARSGIQMVSSMPARGPNARVLGPSFSMGAHGAGGGSVSGRGLGNSASFGGGGGGMHEGETDEFNF